MPSATTRWVGLAAGFAARVARRRSSRDPRGHRLTASARRPQVRFFERVKVDRKRKKLQAQLAALAPDSPEREALSASLEAAEKDLEVRGRARVRFEPRVGLACSRLLPIFRRSTCSFSREAKSTCLC